MNESITVAADKVIKINPTYLFRWEEPQQAYVLLYPEGIIKVNETAAAILKLCDGTHTVQEIISELNDIYSSDVTQGVYKFLEVSYAKGWIRINS